MSDEEFWLLHVKLELLDLISKDLKKRLTRLRVE